MLLLLLLVPDLSCELNYDACDDRIFSWGVLYLFSLLMMAD